MVLFSLYTSTQAEISDTDVIVFKNKGSICMQMLDLNQHTRDLANLNLFFLKPIPKLSRRPDSSLWQMSSTQCKLNVSNSSPAGCQAWDNKIISTTKLCFACAGCGSKISSIISRGIH